jgi:hypothetical protein
MRQMMRARQLEQLIAHRCGRSETDLDMRGRKLREAMYVPSGGRGPHAPEIDARMAATILISAFGADQAIDAVEGVMTFAPMAAVTEQFIGAHTFGEAIETALSSPDLALTVSKVEFIRYFKGFIAGVIEWGSAGQSNRSIYLPEKYAVSFKKDGMDPLKLGGGSGGVSIFIGGGLLQEIAIEIQDDTRTGYANEGPT